MMEVVQIAWPNDEWNLTDRLAVNAICRGRYPEKAKPDERSDDPAFHHVKVLRRRQRRIDEIAPACYGKGMETSVISQFRQGRMCGHYLAFDAGARTGVMFWRWTSRGSGFIRTHVFIRDHIADLAELLNRILGEIDNPPRRKTRAKTWKILERPRQQEECLHEFRDGDVLLTIHLSGRGPWFQFRRVLSEDPMSLGAWFYREDMPALLRAVLEVERWFQEHSADIAA
jgi:hypothetical protein